MKFRTVALLLLLSALAACGTKSPTATEVPETPQYDGTGFLGGGS